MTFKNNIDPIYFNSFVGTWKRMASKGSSTTGYIKFNSDCTFEHDGTLGVIEGTVNGDVDEISIDDDGLGHDQLKTKRDLIKGKAVLARDSDKQVWSFRLGEGRALGIKNNKPILELKNHKGRVIYVGNLPLMEEQPKNNSKIREKV